MTTDPLRRLARAAAALGCLLGLGCTTPPAPPAPPSGPSLYQQLGGRPAILALIADAIGFIASDPRINRRFGSIDPAALQNKLADLVCQRTGGPCVYAGRNMADAHEGMQVRDEEFDALVEDIDKAMRQRQVPENARQQSLVLLYQMRGAITGH